MTTQVRAEARAALDAAQDVLALGRVVRPEARRLAGSPGRRVAGSQSPTFVLAEGDQCYYEDEDAIAPLWKGQRFPMSQCVSGWAMAHGMTAVIPDISVDVRVPAEAYAPTFVRSLVMVPVGTPPITAIGVYWSCVGAPTRRAVEALEAFAPEVAVALRRVGLDAAPWAPTFG